MSFVTRFMNDESGATAIEYGLIAAGVGIVILSGIGSLATGLNTLFGEVAVAL
jgi:pilus assembly protein Flp/PilA